MSIDTTKKVTGITYNGVTIPLGGTTVVERWTPTQDVITTASAKHTHNLGYTPDVIQIWDETAVFPATPETPISGWVLGGVVTKEGIGVRRGYNGTTLSMSYTNMGEGCITNTQFKYPTLSSSAKYLAGHTYIITYYKGAS